MITNEEEYIKSQLADKSPFKVPEGYFEQLTSSVMESLPTEQAPRQGKLRHLRPWLYAAACSAFLIVGITSLYRNKADNNQPQTENMAASNNNDSYSDDAADYAMVDNQDIYAYLLADM